jgi:hypothetical protein
MNFQKKFVNFCESFRRTSKALLNAALLNGNSRFLLGRDVSVVLEIAAKVHHQINPQNLQLVSLKYEIIRVMNNTVFFFLFHESLQIIPYEIKSLRMTYSPFIENLFPHRKNVCRLMRDTKLFFIYRKRYFEGPNSWWDFTTLQNKPYKNKKYLSELLLSRNDSIKWRLMKWYKKSFSNT